MTNMSGTHAKRQCRLLDSKLATGTVAGAEDAFRADVVQLAFKPCFFYSSENLLSYLIATNTVNKREC